MKPSAIFATNTSVPFFSAPTKNKTLNPNCFKVGSAHSRDRQGIQEARACCRYCVLKSPSPLYPLKPFSLQIRTSNPLIKLMPQIEFSFVVTLLCRHALLQSRGQNAAVGDHSSCRCVVTSVLMLLLMLILLLMLLTGTCNEASAIATEVGLKQGNLLLALPTHKNCNTSCRKNRHRRQRRSGLLRQSRPRSLYGGGVLTPCRRC